MLFTAALLTLIPIILAADHPVTVGLNGGLTFTPNQIAADIGDTLTFTFVSKNRPNGFDSGFQPALGTATPQFVYTVVDTDPHFVSCMQAAGAHCRAGMNFALNPTATMTFDDFNSNAMAS
ncbi:hypothetical protein B0H15DRAFT_803500 [Mycena belliarum]|uniref:Uncharacterized protein n=1 Tax=Mycena belliarum TaxID=1033014 RepID=A0AAD6XR31_9AGAR|nr:hypothetical protein B0H15DRAFT_803500 [Mycena belliae]